MTRDDIFAQIKAALVELFEVDGERRARLAIRCINQYGDEKLVGEASVALI